MLLIVGTILAFMFLEWPWRGLVVVALACLEAVEVWLFFKLRKVPASTGVEGMVGAHGRAVTDCDPEGQVRVKGQLWRAYCRSGIRAGDHVTVSAVRGLGLEVIERPVTGAESSREVIERPLAGAESSREMPRRLGS
jgi:membrane-bound serine protease (ClpP class)